MKKLIRLSVLCLLTLCLFIPFTLPAEAASASASIGLSAKSVYVGNQVSVTVSYSADTAIGGWNFSLNYDASMLEYVSGADSHSAGTCRFANVNMDPSSASSSLSFTVVFRALAAGTASVSTSTREIVGEDYSSAAVSDTARSISVTNKPVYVPSTVSTLSALSVEGFELSPAFAAGTAGYTLTVEYPTSALNIKATPTSGAASVSVSGADALAVGENTVTVTVTAESGAKQRYTIKVTRKESPYTAKEVTLTDGTVMTFPIADTGLAVPEGFTAATAQYQGAEVLSFLNASGTIRLAALTRTVTDEAHPDGETVTQWYLFDQDAATFTPYAEYTPGTMRYILLPLPSGTSLPDGYSEVKLMIGEQEITAYRNNRYDERYYLVYAAPVSGGAGFYVYDSLENTFQSYMTYDGAPTQEMLDALNGTLTEKETALATLSAERDALAGQRRLFLMISVALGVAVLALVILLLVVLRRRNSGRPHANTHREEWPEMPAMPEDTPAPQPEEMLPAEEPIERFPEPMTEEDDPFVDVSDIPAAPKHKKKAKAGRAHLPDDRRF